MISEILHKARTEALRRMPQVKGPILSAGCSGNWYFDWVSENYRSVGEHIGVEFYSPKPEGLPANVRWISNTVGDMHEVPDNSVELVFSGQNLEHLWPEDVAGFYNEAWRILKPGGWLIVDSPNRMMANAYKWSHPEHTVEWTPEEAEHITRLAGFEVKNNRGLWICREGNQPAVLPLEPTMGDAEIVRRLIAPNGMVNNSFIWWVEAQKIDRAPGASEQVRAYADSIYQTNWEERCDRFAFPEPVRAVGEGNRTVAKTSEKQHTTLVFGPYIPLRTGSYRATFRLKAEPFGGNTSDVLSVDVIGRESGTIVQRNLTAAEIAANNGVISLDFKIPEIEFRIQARAFSLGTGSVEVEQPEIAKIG